MPVILFQCLLWPWSTTTTRRIDALQSHFVTRLLKIPGRDGEDRSTYWQRRSRAAGELARTNCTRSDKWSHRLATWLEHLNRYPTSWVARMLRTRDSTWLLQHRTMHPSAAYSDTAGRTRTRVLHQRVQLRYEAGITELRKAHPEEAEL